MSTFSSFDSRGTETLGSGACPVVVRPHKDATYFEIQNDNLARLLTNSDVADLPVVVLSVAGGFRLGKSFLLGFCIRYLEHLGISSNPSGWMDEENIPLTGFFWRYGSERETTGIQLWGKVFKVQTQAHGLVAVILMDTEGSFDNRSTMEGNVTIFSMSMLLSSVQVYNLTKQITQADLEHLKLFAEYANMARRAGGQSKEVFQKLLFLIRDWQYYGEKSFGLEGGEELLHPLLQRDLTLPSEVSELRENIRNSFSEVKCFLLPRPGDAVENAGFDGRLRDISEDFKYHLENLMSYLLSPERLVPKKINGRIVTCKELVCMFQTYFTIFNQKELPQPMSVFNATAFVHNKRIIDEIVKKYETAMEGIALTKTCSESDTDIEMQHERLMKQCLSQYDNEQKMGKHDTELREQLVKDLHHCYDMCQRSRKILREYNRDMKDQIGKEREEAQRVYEEKIKQIIEEERSKYMEKIEAMAKTHSLDVEQMKNAMPPAPQVGFWDVALGVVNAIPIFGPLVSGLVRLFRG
ncbi:atlastin-2-like [Ornithodoros turicata]|uniref:atlastin-2-like n=1 Tax=Ornithodoros turicata TaxID=34597 RepID=UPI003139785E